MKETTYRVYLEKRKVLKIAKYIIFIEDRDLYYTYDEDVEFIHNMLIRTKKLSMISKESDIINSKSLKKIKLIKADYEMVIKLLKLLNCEVKIFEDEIASLNRVKNIINSDLQEKDDCSNCFKYKSNECNGVMGLCKDYVRAPEISQKERDNWEKEGDASRYRKKSFYKSGPGYTTIYPGQLY